MFKRYQVVEFYTLARLIYDQILNVARIKVLQLLIARHGQRRANDLAASYDLLLERFPLGLRQVLVRILALLF